MTQATPQQQAIMDAMSDGTGNFAGVARAGTGKTSTFVMGAKNVKAPTVVCCAFNKDIATVMEEKFPPEWLCKTTHSLGLAASMKRFRRSFKVDGSKMRPICNSLPDSQDFPDLLKAVGILKNWGVVPKTAIADPSSMYPDTPETYKSVFQKYGIDTGYAEDPIGLCRQALNESMKQAWQGKIDFDDMLYLAVAYRAPLAQGDLVLIDEAQDIAPIQRGLLRLMMKEDSRLIAIGDDRQAIYGFRGADRESLPNIIEEFSCATLPLTVSFRCPQSVVLEAQKIVPDIEPWSSAPEGEVRTLDKISLQDFPPRSVVLCRYNAPLIALTLKFIKNGIGAKMLGRDVAEGIIKLIKKQKATSLGELTAKLSADVDHQRGLLEARNLEMQASLLMDRADCIHALIAHIGHTGNVRRLIDLIYSMFDPKQKAPITLSSIHKCKGMEWPEVFILNRSSMPSKYAKSQEELIQEDNLIYVAVTRAQERLSYINFEDIG